MASNSEAINSPAGTPRFCRPLMSVSANTPHLPAIGYTFRPTYGDSHSASAGIFSFAEILSMTEPVPPAHLSFIDTVLREAPSVSSSKMMIFASWPPSSMIVRTSGWRRSTASATAATSCT